MSRKPKTIAFWVGRLPHWEVEDGRYFITIHLAGAIPEEGQVRITKLAEEARAIEDKDSSAWWSLERTIFREMELWLHRAEWNASLQHPDVATMVVEAIEHRRKRGDWNVFEYVIMPTHIHLFAEIGSFGLKESVEDFKRWTGHRAARILSEDSERFWQREWFDHWSRSDEEDEKIAKYIRDNPLKAGLVKQYADWPYGSWSKSQ